MQNKNIVPALSHTASVINMRTKVGRLGGRNHHMSQRIKAIHHLKTPHQKVPIALISFNREPSINQGKQNEVIVSLLTKLPPLLATERMVPAQDHFLS